MEDQEGAELSAALLSRLMKGSEAPPVCGIHQAVELDEHGSNIHMLGWEGWGGMGGRGGREGGRGGEGRGGEGRGGREERRERAIGFGEKVIL